MVFVDQAAEPVAATEPIEREHYARAPTFRWMRDEGWPLAKRACGRCSLIVDRARDHDVLQMPATDDQQPVKAFAAQAADPALGVRPGERAGALITQTPSDPKTSSKSSVKLAVAVNGHESRSSTLPS